MIRVYASMSEYIEIKVEGHANYGKEKKLPKGNDIICAAVSTLAQTAMIYADSIGSIMECEARDGYLIFKTIKTKETETMLDIFKIGIEKIICQYPNYVGWGK